MPAVSSKALHGSNLAAGDPEDREKAIENSRAGALAMRLSMLGRDEVKPDSNDVESPPAIMAGMTRATWTRAKSKGFSIGWSALGSGQPSICPMAI